MSFEGYNVFSLPEFSIVYHHFNIFGVGFNVKFLDSSSSPEPLANVNQKGYRAFLHGLQGFKFV